MGKYTNTYICLNVGIYVYIFFMSMDKGYELIIYEYGENS